MNVEIQNFIKIWIIAIASIIYCYYIVSKIPSGLKTRLPFILPIIILFIVLPLDLSSVNLGRFTFFYLVWLGNFKLLLFAFNKPPLSSSPPLSLLHFIFIALLPIKSKQESQISQTQELPKITKTRTKLFLIGKSILLAIIVYIYHYRSFLHQYFLLSLYCIHIYLEAELALFITAIPVHFILGLDIEPQFNEPYLSTSLQDFWGRRWNLVATSILRPTIYFPVRNYIITLPLWTREWGTPLATLARFLVSGLLHETIYYYLTRVSPTWEVTWFFILHGVCVSVEVVVKKKVGGKWRLHKGISRVLTVWFVMITSIWLFLAQAIRNGVEFKVIDELRFSGFCKEYDAKVLCIVDVRILLSQFHRDCNIQLWTICATFMSLLRTKLKPCHYCGLYPSNVLFSRLLSNT